MKVTICGHAGLYVETTDQRILIDPYFANTLVGGVLTFNPGRVLDIDKIPNPTLLVVTHGHFDHFHPDSLQRFDRDLPIVTADDPPVVEQLHELGFSRVIPCSAWQVIKIGETRLVTTPSDHEEEELGLLVLNNGCSFWHMADSEATVQVGQQLVNQFGVIDLISAKHQPSVRSMMGYTRNMGAAFNKEDVITWLEAACVCQPQLIFPYASGLCFTERHSWFNRYAFPLTAAEVVTLLQQRLGTTERAANLLPGDVVELLPGQAPQVHAQASSFVQVTATVPIVWEPIDATTLSGLRDPMQKSVLQQQLETVLTQPIALWLTRKFSSPDQTGTLFPENDIVWQLVVHVSENERLQYFIDFRTPHFVASPGTHPEANFFSHISGQTLSEVLQHQVPGLALLLTGSVRNYEKIILIRNHRFCPPNLSDQPEFHLCDPLTYYLRHFGTGELSPHEPDLVEMEGEPIRATAPALEDMELLSRRGGNERVLSKKALLSYLASQEAARIGLTVTNDEVQAASDSFRRLFGLLDPQDAEQWFAETGMTMDAYVTMMRHFATVIKLEQHYATTIEPLMLEHQRIADAQAVLSQV